MNFFSKILFFLFLFSLQVTVFSQNIELRDSGFVKGDEKFIPVGVNYAFGFKKLENNEIYFTLASTQCAGGNCGNTKEEIQNNLLSNLQDIENKGFNTLRLAGFAMYKNDFKSEVGFNVLENGKSKFYSAKDITPYIDAIEDAIIFIENNSDLKLIIITGSHGVDDINVRDEYTSFLEQLSNRLENYDCIFAYDIYNEPPFFVVDYNYSKCEIADITHEWYKALTGRHLVTIGLFGTLDLFQFDPEIVTVDFINFHIFPYMLEWNDYDYQVAEDITAIDYKWIAKNVRKPWIVGETAFPGSDFQNSENLAIGTETEQEQFAEYTINAVKAAGGLGIVWWQYSEVDWYNLNEDGDKARNNCYGIRYSEVNNVPAESAFKWKKAADVLPRFTTIATPVFEIENEKYYNPKHFDYEGVMGDVLDSCGNPISDARVEVNFKYENPNNPSEKISESNETFTDEYGYFHVYAPAEDYELVALKATATGYSYIKLYNNDIPEKDFYEIKLSLIPDICTPYELKYKNVFKVFPNPASDFIKIINKNDNTNIIKIELINMYGKTIYSDYNCFDTKQFLINVEGVTNGIYLLRITHSWGQWSEKIIVDK